MLFDDLNNFLESLRIGLKRHGAIMARFARFAPLFHKLKSIDG
jgi:hypothetical protein